MAITTTQVQQITDSVAQGISDFNTAFVTNTGTNAPLYSTIVSGVTGTGGSATQGRVLGLNDLTSELAMLTPANKTAANVTAYITSVRSISAFYQQYYPLLDALDFTTSGLNAYLTSNTMQVNAWFAAAFNAYAAVAVALGYRTTANVPTAIGTANYFPYAAIDTMWGFTCSGATTFSANAVGANASTAVAGGGVAQFYLYKNNASNAVGGATFTITYTKADGTTANVNYSTVSGTPTASGSLASGSVAISGAIGQSITAVTGTGMTSGEQFTIAAKIVRAATY